MDKEAGRAASLLQAWGVITATQRRAADSYRAAHEEWRRTQGLPTRHGKTSYLPVATAPDELTSRAESRKRAERAAMSPDERGIAEAADAEEATKNWTGILAVVRRIQPTALVMGVLDMVCIEDVAPETWRRAIVSPQAVSGLQSALEALAKYFGIVDAEESAA